MAHNVCIALVQVTTHNRDKFAMHHLKHSYCWLNKLNPPRTSLNKIAYCSHFTFYVQIAFKLLFRRRGAKKKTTATWWNLFGGGVHSLCHPHRNRIAAYFIMAETNLQHFNPITCALNELVTHRCTLVCASVCVLCVWIYRLYVSMLFRITPLHCEQVFGNCFNACTALIHF